MIDYDKINIDTNGYPYIYLPNNTMANKAGKVYIHRLIMSIKLGRILTSEEIVHHKDENKLNYDPDNLELTNHIDHGKLHHNSLDKKECEYCNELFQPFKNKIKYCSQKCSQLDRRKFNIKKEELEILVWSMSTIKLSKLLNVSDTAISKRCKRYGIKKPPRGYWAKIYVNI